VLFALGVRAGECGWLTTLPSSRTRRFGKLAAVSFVALLGRAVSAVATGDPEGVIAGLNAGTLAFAFSTAQSRSAAVCGS
jgi:hypothetical protein